MKSIEEVIIENKNLIYSITNYFDNYGLDRKEDLFQAGVIGMINAYNHFDETLGVKFTTYAYPHILGEIKKYVREDKGVTVSRGISELGSKIEKVSLMLSQKLYREPTSKEIADYLDLPEYLIADAINSKKEIRSIDEPVAFDSREITLHETIPSKEKDINTLIALKEELLSLSEFERELISSRYFEDRTQTETAESLGISQVQVSRQEQKVLIKLKNKLAS